MALKLGLVMDVLARSWVVLAVARNRSRSIDCPILKRSHAHLDGIRASISLGVEALSAQEIIFDEFEVGVKAQCLVIDVTLFGIGADNESGNAQTIAILIDVWRYHVVVKAAPVVP